MHLSRQRAKGQVTELHFGSNCVRACSYPPIFHFNLLSCTSSPLYLHSLFISPHFLYPDFTALSVSTTSLFSTMSLYHTFSLSSISGCFLTICFLFVFHFPPLALSLIFISIIPENLFSIFPSSLSLLSFFLPLQCIFYP